MALETKAAHRKDLLLRLAPMQHRHFATIATIIREMSGGFSEEEREDIAVAFADRLRETNPNFDRDRFLRACAG